MKKYYIFLVFSLYVGLFINYSQQDCSSALSVCTDANSGGVVNDFGNDDFNGSNVSGCLRNGLGVNTIETNSYWFRVKLAESGEFGFNIIPNDLSEDWDFAVYGPNPSCGALGEPIACSYAGGAGYTGVGLNPSTNTQTSAYDAWMNVTVGDEYVVLINQYSGDNTGFSITWEGAVITDNTDPLDCSILVDLGPDRDLCTGQFTDLNATVFGASVNYEWFVYNELTSSFEAILPAQTTEKYRATTSGTYKVEVTNTSTFEVLSDEIVVTFHAIPIANAVGNIVLCDSDNNGVEAFDLESQTTAISNGQPNVTVTYYEFELFAQLGADPKTSPYISSGHTIWARIENSSSPSCYDITSFEVLAVPPPVAIQPPNLEECDNDNDGEMTFNLDNQTSIILNGGAGIVTYYEDEQNAIDRKGWITNTATYSTVTRTIWVRVESNSGSTCSNAIISFEIEVVASATANLPVNILECDNDNDGYLEFDFRASKDAEILGTQESSIFEINYFATQADADNNVNILSIPYTNVTPYAQETIFARIQNKAFIECYDTTSFTLQVFDTAFPAMPSNIPDLIYCDNSLDGDDTNGIYEFDLTERTLDILNGQSTYVFNVTYFEDPDYSAGSQILNPLAYNNRVRDEQTIYVRVVNSNPNNNSCYSDTSFNIKVNSLPNILLTTFKLIQCDEDGTLDGVTDFNLAEADTFVTLGDLTLNVTYHLSSADAASGINVQNKYPFSNFLNSTVYARVESANGCYRIVQVDLVISGALFPPNYMRELIACDVDSANDGVYEFDLAKTTSEILAQFFPIQNLRVAFYRNQENALSETNKINPTNSYLNETPYSQIIWVRVESITDGGCAGIAPAIQLTVNPRPEFELDETAILCLNDLPKTVSIYNANDITYTYEWTDEIGNIVSQKPSAEIIEAGIYTVIATSNLGCESLPKQISIIESIIADISSDDIQISDNSSNNSITIITDNQNLGSGDYEFALDDINGPYQDSPTFSHVIPGEHTIFVQDKNKCGIVQVTVYIFGFPKFFTPNGDGSNDTWNVRGIDFSIFPKTKIYIYDRYGKMIANFSAFQEGWDGMYNGNKAFSTDYWYLAQMEDYNGTVKEYKGHFSLIRR